MITYHRELQVLILLLSNSVVGTSNICPDMALPLLALAFLEEDIQLGDAPKTGAKPGVVRPRGSTSSESSEVRVFLSISLSLSLFI